MLKKLFPTLKIVSNMKRSFMKTAAVLFAAVALSAIFTTCIDPFAADLTAPAPANEAAGVPTRTVAFTVIEAEDGTVTLEYVPPVRNSRALSLPLAKAATDFYEVVFVDESGGTPKVWRRNFREGQTVRMTVADGEYDNGVNGAGTHIAYMFAGRYDSKTLLAIGKVSKVEYKDNTYDDGGNNTYTGGTGTAGEFLINGDAKIVTFELEALRTDIMAGEFSTFQSWDLSNGNDPFLVDPNETNDEYVDGKSVLWATINGKIVPVFTIPKEKATNGVITIESNYTQAVKASPVLDSSKFFDSRGFLEQGIKVPMANVTVDFNNVDHMNDPNAYHGTGALYIPITMTPVDDKKDGLAVFTYSIPVYNYSDAASENNGTSPITWYVRGGLSNNQYDLGPDNDSQGGKIVLGIGDLSGIKIIADDEDGFYINGGYPPHGGNPPGNTNITFTAVQVGGGANYATTGIEFTFSQSVDSLGLTAGDFTVTNGTGQAVKGAVLTGSGTTRTLSIASVALAGNVTVSINKAGIEAGAKTVAVYAVPAGSAGLEFVLISGGVNNNTYRVKNYDTWNRSELDPDVVIPATHGPSTCNPADCGELHAIEAPVTEIGSLTDGYTQNPFYDASHNFIYITSVSIPPSVNIIGNYAFNGCQYGLASIHIPANVTVIGEGAFDYCLTLAHVTFAPGSQLQTISSSAFFDCTSLTDIIIPAAVATIGQQAFHGCDNLTTVIFEGSGVSIADANSFPGDLRAKYSGAGTYTRSGNTWTKQP